MRRDQNQDAFGIIKKEAFHAYFVADGMGGVRGGAVASRTAVSSLEELVKEQESLPSEELIASILNTVNHRIFEKGGADPALAGMGTTLVGLLFSADTAYCVNVGDSRAYRVRAGSIIQLSEDHTLVRELVCSGAITPEQAEHHPVAHMLTRSLGPLEEIQSEVIRLEPTQHGDIYLLCSDGLYNFVEPNEIVDVVQQNPLDDASQILINLANQRGGTDNITVVIVAVGDTSSKRRSAQYRHARDVVAQGAKEVPAREQALRGDIEGIKSAGEPAHATEEDSGAGTSQAETATAATTQFIAPPQVQEPPDLDRVEASRQRKRGGYHKPKARLPVPLLVVAALVLGMVVGSLAKKFVQPEQSAQVALLSGREEGKDSPLRGVSEQLTGSPQREARSSQYDDERAAASSDHNPEKDKLVRDAFETSIRKLESQIAALDKPTTATAREDVAQVKKRAEDIQTNLASIEEQIGAASRKLQQWYARQKRLETQDPLKLAGEVGASSESVQRKKADFEASTYELIRTLDDVEQNHPNDEEKKAQLAELKERRARLLRELQDDVRDTVDTVLQETNKHVEDLKIQRQLFTFQLETVKQDLEYAKALAETNPEKRAAMRKRLEQNLEGLRGSLVDLERIVSGSDGADERTSTTTQEASTAG